MCINQIDTQLSKLQCSMGTTEFVSNRVDTGGQGVKRRNKKLMATPN